MDRTIYFFSGTGNSLAVAREIAQRLDAGEPVSIPRALAGIADSSGSSASPGPDESVGVSGSVIGIVSPIYMHNVPHIVARFIRQIVRADYLFFVFAGGGELGNGGPRVQRLCAGNGIRLDALFNVPMPSNYTPYGYPDEASRSAQLSAVLETVDSIVDIVRNQGQHTDPSGTGFVATHLYPGPLYQLGYRFIPKMDGSFSVDDTCTRCGICARVCPVANITLEGGKPVWHHTCEQCYACLQWCPVQAIQSGKKTRGVERYHHPAVTVQEVINAGPAPST